jgi:polyphosphate kinase
MSDAITDEQTADAGPVADAHARGTAESDTVESVVFDSTSAPEPVRPGEDPLPDDRYLNREASWLDFNARVLELGEDPEVPLLERAKFLAIFASNMDEFFMVRVAGLKRRRATGLTVRSADGLSIREQLELIAKVSGELAQRHARAFADDVRPALEEKGIQIERWESLSEPERERLGLYFSKQVFPVLTPLAVDPAHPFPYISGLSLNIATVVRDNNTGTEHFARVKVPPNVPRFVLIEGERFLPLERLIGAHLYQLFPGMEVRQWHVFRVTRNADVEVEEDRDEDLLQQMERELARRRFGPAVRLECQQDIDDYILGLLVRELEISDRDVLRLPGLLDLSGLFALADLDRPDLKEDPFVPASHPKLVEGEAPADFFTVLREGDVLVHHPYQSFATSTQRFIEQAAADPAVLAIKQTLYRTSGDSPIVDALIDAAEAGKQVVVLVEIKARFDETANIKWARALERAGCHVVYGFVGLKTHCKTALVVRQEAGELRRYCHVGTGNYNPKTARLYEDFGLLTADRDVGADLTDLFNVLTGYSRQTDYRRLITAPHRLRAGIIERIEAEAAASRAGRPSGIRIKANSLVDERVIDALYRASAAGVRVEGVVRGICSLVPGRQGLSENIRIRSVLGRFLEHSRVFEFEAQNETWIGSADMMHRNLDRRVETMLQLTDPGVRRQIRAILDLSMSPMTRAWDLHEDGTWTRGPATGPDGRLENMQTTLMQQARRPVVKLPPAAGDP